MHAVPANRYLRLMSCEAKHGETVDILSRNVMVPSKSVKKMHLGFALIISESGMMNQESTVGNERAATAR